MRKTPSVSRKRQFCGRCGLQIFEFFASPDGHFGLASELTRDSGVKHGDVHCPTCGARYRMLDRISNMGQVVRRK